MLSHLLLLEPACISARQCFALTISWAPHTAWGITCTTCSVFLQSSRDSHLRGENMFLLTAELRELSVLQQRRCEQGFEWLFLRKGCRPTAWGGRDVKGWWGTVSYRAVAIGQAGVRGVKQGEDSGTLPQEYCQLAGVRLHYKKSQHVCRPGAQGSVTLLLVGQGCWQVVLDPGNPWTQEYQTVNIYGLPWRWAGRTE